MWILETAAALGRHRRTFCDIRILASRGLERLPRPRLMFERAVNQGKLMLAGKGAINITDMNDELVMRLSETGQ